MGMRVIGIDTSTQATGLCCVNFNSDGDYTVEAHRVIEQERTRAEAMLPVLSALMDEVGIGLADVDAIAVTKGPGSFTGLRIGVTIAKTMAQFTNRPVYGVSTLEAMAFGHPEGRLICPVIDARADRIFSALYKTTAGRPEVLIPEGLYYEADFAARLEACRSADSDSAIGFIGAGVSRHKALLEAFSGRRVLLEGIQGVSPVLEAGRIAALRHALGDADDVFQLTPNYLRKSQAEMDRGRA